jgi:cysteinyl-tRNA synthetase
MLAVVNCSSEVHEAMCRNFDTPAVLGALVKLVKVVNVYLGPSASTSAKPAVPTLRKAAALVTKVLRVLGVVEGTDDLGFPLTGLGGGGGGGGGGGEGGQEELLAPYLDVFRDFRHEVRTIMRGAGKAEGGAEAAVGHALAACDRVRDQVLPKLGVKLEDLSAPPAAAAAAAAGGGGGGGSGGGGGGGSSRWKLDDPAVLVREIEERMEKEAAAKAEKAAKQLAAARKKLSDATDAQVPPSELFRSGPKAAQYSAFGDDGVPTHAKVAAPAADADGAAVVAVEGALGEPLSKSALKSLAKEKANHEKKHTKLSADATKAGLSVEEHINRLAAEVTKLTI